MRLLPELAKIHAIFDDPNVASQAFAATRLRGGNAAGGSQLAHLRGDRDGVGVHPHLDGPAGPVGRGGDGGHGVRSEADHVGRLRAWRDASAYSTNSSAGVTCPALLAGSRLPGGANAVGRHADAGRRADAPSRHADSQKMRRHRTRAARRGLAPRTSRCPQGRRGPRRRRQAGRSRPAPPARSGRWTRTRRARPDTPHGHSVISSLTEIGKRSRGSGTGTGCYCGSRRVVLVTRVTRQGSGAGHLAVGAGVIWWACRNLMRAARGDRLAHRASLLTSHRWPTAPTQVPGRP